jgi:FecR protein
MSDDYLWDGGESPGPDDQDVARLERMLGQLRRPLPAAPDITHLTPSRATRASPNNIAYATVRFWAPALAMAAAIVLMIAGTYRTRTTGDPAATWEVAPIDGQPRIESALQSARLNGVGRLAVGQTLSTDHESRARLDVSTIGQVTIDPNTRVRMVSTREGRHELALARGTLHAFITAPPGQFVVNTPSSTAIDLGCVYTLHIDEDGSGLLSVAAGWVAFEYKGRESFVPARASSRTDPEFGPGTPRYDDVDEAFQQALERFDYDRDRTARSAGLAYILEQARPKDAMTLWHLIARTDGTEREAVIDALEKHSPMPLGVTRDAVTNLNRAALDLWWDSLGLQDASWWRKWKGPYPAQP